MAALDGKVAVVTGGSSGMGTAIGETLAAAGAKVALIARRKDRLDAVVERITAAGGTAIAIPADVTDEAQAVGAVEQAIAQFGRVDILVNAAGMSQTAAVDTGDLNDYRDVMNLNFMAAVYTCRAAMVPMREQGSGDIVNISSMASKMTVAGGMSAYGISKKALNNLTDGLRQELGKHGVRVCLLVPGGTKTEFAEAIKDEQGRAGMRYYLSRDGLMEATDVANMILTIVTLPPNVNVAELVMHPTMDSF
jgi:NADP-dependent 3-hydroxy acid dehydrogenase YdfG